MTGATGAKVSLLRQIRNSSSSCPSRDQVNTVASASQQVVEDPDSLSVKGAAARASTELEGLQLLCEVASQLPTARAGGERVKPEAGAQLLPQPGPGKTASSPPTSDTKSAVRASPIKPPAVTRNEAPSRGALRIENMKDAAEITMPAARTLQKSSGDRPRAKPSKVSTRNLAQVIQVPGARVSEESDEFPQPKRPKIKEVQPQATRLLEDHVQYNSAVPSTTEPEAAELPSPHPLGSSRTSGLAGSAPFPAAGQPSHISLPSSSLPLVSAGIEFMQFPLGSGGHGFNLPLYAAHLLQTQLPAGFSPAGGHLAYDNGRLAQFLSNASAIALHQQQQQAPQQSNSAETRLPDHQLQAARGLQASSQTQSAAQSSDQPQRSPLQHELILAQLLSQHPTLAGRLPGQVQYALPAMNVVPSHSQALQMFAEHSGPNVSGPERGADADVPPQQAHTIQGTLADHALFKPQEPYLKSGFSGIPPHGLFGPILVNPSGLQDSGTVTPAGLEQGGQSVPQVRVLLGYPPPSPGQPQQRSSLSGLPTSGSLPPTQSASRPQSPPRYPIALTGNTPGSGSGPASTAVRPSALPLVFTAPTPLNANGGITSVHHANLLASILNSGSAQQRPTSRISDSGLSSSSAQRNPSPNPAPKFTLLPSPGFQSAFQPVPASGDNQAGRQVSTSLPPTMLFPHPQHPHVLAMPFPLASTSAGLHLASSDGRPPSSQQQAFQSGPSDPLTHPGIPIEYQGLGGNPIAIGGQPIDMRSILLALSKGDPAATGMMVTHQLALQAIAGQRSGKPCDRPEHERAMPVQTLPDPVATLLLAALKGKYGQAPLQGAAANQLTHDLLGTLQGCDDLCEHAVTGLHQTLSALLLPAMPMLPHEAQHLNAEAAKYAATQLPAMPPRAGSLHMPTIIPAARPPSASGQQPGNSTDDSQGGGVKMQPMSVAAMQGLAQGTLDVRTMMELINRGHVVELPPRSSYRSDGQDMGPQGVQVAPGIWLAASDGGQPRLSTSGGRVAEVPSLSAGAAGGGGGGGGWQDAQQLDNKPPVLKSEGNGGGGGMVGASGSANSQNAVHIVASAKVKGEQAGKRRRGSKAAAKNSDAEANGLPHSPTSTVEAAARRQLIQDAVGRRGALGEEGLAPLAAVVVKSEGGGGAGGLGQLLNGWPLAAGRGWLSDAVPGVNSKGSGGESCPPHRASDSGRAAAAARSNEGRVSDGQKAMLRHCAKMVANLPALEFAVFMDYLKQELGA